MSSVLAHLEGRLLERVALDADTKDWVFSFTGKMSLRIATPWRVCRGDVIQLGWEDDAQLFGLPAPVDAQTRLASLLQGPARSVDVGAYGDLTIAFDGSVTLNVFNASMGYEGWQLYGPGDQYVVAQGGGAVVSGHARTGR